MKRRGFLKNLGIGVGTMMVAPKIIANVVPEESNIKDIEVVDEVYIESIVAKYQTANISKKYNFTFKEKHNNRLNDIIFVKGGRLESCYIVCIVKNDFKLWAVPTNKEFMLDGEVDVVTTGRNFIKNGK
jgi:hypothetical protein